MVPAKETLLTAVQATNFTNYMYEVGVDGFTRKIACSLYPTATNELVDQRTKLHQELFPDLKFPRQYSNYHCVLMNDEGHSYDEVTRVLEWGLQMSRGSGLTALTGQTRNRWRPHNLRTFIWRPHNCTALGGASQFEY